jgi:TonB family protein
VSSPWKILGIKAGSDRDTIRRAYAKKLKGVNPEDDPEGFMRLRQAHDDALAQLKWRQNWPEPEEIGEETEPAGSSWVGPPPDGPHGGGASRSASGEAMPAELPTAPQPEPLEPDPAQQAAQAELEDLAARQQAFTAAIAAGPDGQLQALDHLLAAPALETITQRERIERWIAATIRRRLPASDPLVVPAITHFGWGEIGAEATSADVTALLQRREEGEFIARIARPHTDLHVGYMALQALKGPNWWRRLSALFSAAPAQTRTILGMADGPLPGIADWLDSAAMDWWREWHSQPRLRLWMFLVLFPMAAVALVTVLEPTGWPEGVQAVVGILAYAAPFAMLWLLRFRQGFQADWQRPDWQYRAWVYAALALPVLAAAWPPFAELGPLWLLIVAVTVALAIVSVNRLLPDAPNTLVVGLVRAWPAWALLWFAVLGVSLPAWSGPVVGLLVPALAIIWWQGGDELSWTAQRWLGARALWALPLLAALLLGVAAPVLLAAPPDPALAARALALLPLALLLLLLAFRLAEGWWQAPPAALIVMLVALAVKGGVGLDRAERAQVPAVAAQPLAEFGQWLDVEPALKTLPRGEHRFRVALDIDRRGRVRGCTLLKGTGITALDAQLCPQLSAKARYRPARNANGTAVASRLELRGGWTVKAAPLPVEAAAPAPAAPARPPAPAISCAGVGDGGSGPMVAEPCMPDQWVPDGAYPPAALALGQSGTVGYRLLVDIRGRAESCDIIESSGHAALDRGTCDLVMRRARFLPARGVDGAPMPWSFRGSVKWVLARR